VDGVDPDTFLAVSSILCEDLRCVARLRKKARLATESTRTSVCVRAFYVEVQSLLRDLDAYLNAESTKDQPSVLRLVRKLKEKVVPLRHAARLESLAILPPPDGEEATLTSTPRAITDTSERKSTLEHGTITKTRIDFGVLWEAAVGRVTASYSTVAQRLFLASFGALVHLLDSWIFDGRFVDDFDELPLERTTEASFRVRGEHVGLVHRGVSQFIDVDAVLRIVRNRQLLTRLASDRRSLRHAISRRDDCAGLLATKWSLLCPRDDLGEFASRVHDAVWNGVGAIDVDVEARVLDQLRDDFRVLALLRALPEVLLFLGSDVHDVMVAAFRCATEQCSVDAGFDLNDQLHDVLASSAATACFASVFNVRYQIDQKVGSFAVKLYTDG
jgi:hypothetical protein